MRAPFVYNKSKVLHIIGHIGHNLTIKQADDAMCIRSIVLGVGHHQDGGSLLIQFGK